MFTFCFYHAKVWIFIYSCISIISIVHYWMDILSRKLLHWIVKNDFFFGTTHGLLGTQIRSKFGIFSYYDANVYFACFFYIVLLRLKYTFGPYF